MKKILALLLTLALCGSLFPAALAQEETFADVPAGSWFEEGVITCARTGVMVGVGDGLFAPDQELTQAECLALAFRLYDLIRGETPAVEQAPEDWGKMTLILADGTVFSGYGYDSAAGDEFAWWSYKNDYQGVYVQVPGWSDEDMTAGAKAQQVWMDVHPDICDSSVDSPATLTLNGVTYSGTTRCWLPVGSYVLMFRPEDDQVNDVLHHAVYRERSSRRWWRDTCYTIVQRGLEDIFDPADFTDSTASRSFFAIALAAGCEDSLEKCFTVEDIPDLPREENGTQTDVHRAVYTLYEAGILTGIDDRGTFDPDGTLTRAQAAVMAARVLDESQRLTAPPKGMKVQQEEPLVTEKYDTYDQAVTQLRDSGIYVSASEQTYETELCTVFVYDCGGVMHAPKGNITIIYKPGAPLGEGTVIHCQRPSPWLFQMVAKDIALSEDGGTLTYTYRLDEPRSLETGYLEAGDYVYTVDLATGKVTKDFPEAPDYETVLARTLEGYAADGCVVEQTVEAPMCTLLFHYLPAENGNRSYGLDMIYKSDVDRTSEGTVRSISLPTTAEGGGGLGFPSLYTHQMPDTMTLSEDGNTFTFTYNQCLDGSSCTQTVDLKTGLCQINE